MDHSQRSNMITPEQAIANVEQRVRELRLKSEWVNKEMGGLPVTERSAQIHCLFEGLCPVCGGEVTLTRVGGSRRFLNEMVFMGSHEVCEWEAVLDSCDDGGVEFKCKNGHEHYVGYSFVSGDWH